MTKSQYNKILSNLSIGAVQLPNRIVFGSHPTNFAKRNMMTDQHVAYYRERAKGGAGMIVLEEQVVHPSDLPYEKAPFGFISDIIPGYRKIATEVHKFGSVVVAQLNHSGMQSDGSTAMHELWAPSPVPDVVSREVPKAMEESDIREIVAGFAKTAEHVAEGGLDGVEINAAQFSLIRQFMSALTNHRADNYGGDLTNRLRFCNEILLAVRKVLGRDKLLGIRLCGDEFAPWGGLTPDDAVTIALELEKLQVLDYITVAVGSLFSLNVSWATYYTDQGPAMEVASRIKQAVKMPVFAEGRIHRPEYAARLVEEGLVDGVYMNRALICDPGLPAKMADGNDELVRECLACNQGCQGRRSMGKPISCILNALVGVEAKEDKHQLSKVAVPKRVLVVGGGPAGMEAARIASARGHQVTLWESQPDTGGEMALSAPFMGEFGRTLTAWKKQLAAAGVQVVAGKQAAAEDILKENPDAVILATGSKTVEPRIEVTGCRKISALAILQNGPVEGKTVLFWDEIGDQLMARAMEKILAGGCKVYFVTPDLFAGNKLASTMELGAWNQRLMSGSTEIYTSCKVKTVSGNKAVIENRFSGKIQELSGFDVLVYNCWPKPNDELYPALKNLCKEIHRVGDCLAPRGISSAVREGYITGRSI